jgi:hypothetical protein
MLFGKEDVYNSEALLQVSFNNAAVSYKNVIINLWRHG